MCEVRGAWLDFSHLLRPVACCPLHLPGGQLAVDLLDYDVKVLLVTSFVNTNPHEKPAINVRFTQLFSPSLIQKRYDALIIWKQHHWSLVRDAVLRFKFGEDYLRFFDDELSF
jgi:hypothetical protein